MPWVRRPDYRPRHPSGGRRTDRRPSPARRPRPSTCPRTGSQTLARRDAAAEHRGDGHNAVLLAHGIGGTEVHVLLALSLGMKAEELVLVDERKTLDLLAAGFAVVRLRENPLPSLALTIRGTWRSRCIRRLHVRRRSRPRSATG